MAFCLARVWFHASAILVSILEFCYSSSNRWVSFKNLIFLSVYYIPSLLVLHGTDLHGIGFKFLTGFADKIGHCGSNLSQISVVPFLNTNFLCQIFSHEKSSGLQWNLTL